MSSRTARRVVSVLAVSALGLGTVACTSDEPSGTAGGDETPVQPSAQDLVRASVDGLDGGSYTMESLITVNDLEFMVMTSQVEGEASRSSQDNNMSAILEASGEDLSADPETAQMMEALFADMHTETVVADGTAYLQITGGMYDAVAETYGEDAWFTMELTGGIAGVYEQFGGVDLASLTEAVLAELDGVEETGDGVYTGTLSAESTAFKSFPNPAFGTAATPADMAATVTLDGDGLLKSLTLALPETDGIAMELTSEVTEIGGEYGITAPDSDNLHPFEDLAALLG